MGWGGKGVGRGGTADEEKEGRSVERESCETSQDACLVLLVRV